MPISSGSTTEIRDLDGSTKAYSGTATTTETNIPTVADKIISQVTITCDGNNFQVSFDGGSTYFTMEKRDTLCQDVKGKITQIKVKTTSSTVNYKTIINFEDI